jgi:DNA-binding MarR family transcriptional regulator
MSGLPSRRVSQTAASVHAAVSALVRRLRLTPLPPGLSWPRASALALVVKHRGISMTDLAAAESVAMPTMTRMVDALEEQGLIVRKRGSEDRRSVLLAATARGRELVERARGQRVEAIARAVARLEPAEVEELARAAPVLERLTELL